MWVTAADRTRCGRFKRDEHRTAPALDQSSTDGTLGGHARGRKVSPGRQCIQDALDQTTGLLQLIEAHRDARGHVAFTPTDLRWGKLRVRLTRQVDAKIERLGARAPGEPRESQTGGELWSNGARAGEPIAHAFVFVIDRAQRECLSRKLAHA